MEFIAFLCTVDMLVSVLLYVRDRNQADDNCSFRVMSVLPEHLCTNSLSLIMSAHPILQVLDKEIRKARGGGHRKWREREGERDKGLKATSWVDVCQLTVNTLGSDYKTRANDSPMISLPNNVLHVSPSATFFPFSSIFL